MQVARTSCVRLRLTSADGFSAASRLAIERDRFAVLAPVEAAFGGPGPAHDERSIAGAGGRVRSRPRPCLEAVVPRPLAGEPLSEEIRRTPAHVLDLLRHGGGGPIIRHLSQGNRDEPIVRSHGQAGKMCHVPHALFQGDDIRKVVVEAECPWKRFKSQFMRIKTSLFLNVNVFMLDLLWHL